MHLATFNLSPRTVSFITSQISKGQGTILLYRSFNHPLKQSKNVAHDFIFSLVQSTPLKWLYLYSYNSTKAIKKNKGSKKGVTWVTTDFLTNL
jgi:hypothetical protein